MLEEYRMGFLPGEHRAELGAAPLGAGPEPEPARTRGSRVMEPDGVGRFEPEFEFGWVWSGWVWVTWSGSAWSLARGLLYLGHDVLEGSADRQNRNSLPLRQAKLRRKSPAGELGCL